MLNTEELPYKYNSNSNSKLTNITNSNSNPTNITNSNSNPTNITHSNSNPTNITVIVTVNLQI